MNPTTYAKYSTDVIACPNGKQLKISTTKEHETAVKKMQTLLFPITFKNKNNYDSHTIHAQKRN